ncbi:MAG: cytochrome P450 [Chloroflexi bacterium]|nr:cytochrome P450 [Chloroflexota bacterium]MBV9603437.1 cytochrome P450 [Chloroflexota bacterium]
MCGTLVQERGSQPGELQLDPFAPELLIDPYPTYARLRAQPQVYVRSTRNQRPFPVLSRYSDVQLALRDPRFARSGFGDALRAALGDGPLGRSFAHWMIFQDPPVHTRLRGLVSQAFSPRSVERLQGQISTLVDALLDALRGCTAFDLMAEFAYPLPMLVISELLGVPAADRARFGQWSAAVARGVDSVIREQPDALARADAAATGLTAYFRELMARRRRTPADDLLSRLAVAEQQGDSLSEDELLATCVMLLVAGHETTVNLIGNGLLALFRNPDQLQRLRGEPGIASPAVEELLRFDSPVQRTGRVATVDVELGNRQIIRAGDRITLLLGAANRDPMQFAEPDQLDLGRANAGRHVSFGSGIHYCVGAPLARLEAQIALPRLLQRFPNLRLLSEAVAWQPTFGLRGLQVLPVAI